MYDMSLVVLHSYNYEVLDKITIGCKKHLFPGKRWGMTKIGSTNGCPYVTTTGSRIFLT